MKLKIKELREELQLTQTELAEKIGNVQRNISNWENGTNEPDCETIIKLADFFNVSLDELFLRNGDYTVTQCNTDKQIIYEIKRLSQQHKEILLKFLQVLNDSN